MKNNFLPPFFVLIVFLTISLNSSFAEANETSKHPPTMEAEKSSNKEQPKQWGLICENAEKNSHSCTLGQELKYAQNNQTVLILRIKSEGLSKASGELILPFGLDVTKDVILQVDNGRKLKISLKTCLPQGCIAKFSINQNMINTLKNGKNLKISVMVSEHGATVFNMSLSGFTEEYNQMIIKNDNSK